MTFFEQVKEFLYSKVNLFGFEVMALWLVIAGAILFALILTIIIISAVSASRKKKAKKIAAFEAEQRLKAEQQAKAEQEEAEKRAAERAAAEEEAKKIEAKQAAAKKRVAQKKAAEKVEEPAAEPVVEEKKEEPAVDAAPAKPAKKSTKKAKKVAEPVAEEAPVEEAKAEETVVEEKKEEVAPVEEVKEEPAVEATPAKPAKKSTKKAKKAAEPVVEEAPVEEAKAEETVVEEKKEEVTPVEEVKEEPAAKASRYSGKWVITKATVENEDGEHYFFELRASNGQLLLTSWEYNSQQGALRGMETYKSNIEKGNFRVYETKKGEFFFKLLTAKNTLLGTGANYPTKEGCEKTIESVKRFASTAVVDDKVRELVLKANEEDDFSETIEQVADSYVGKWIITVKQSEDGKEIYTFELIANNGQLLLSSEEYTSYVGVINGINTHKTNIQKGNFSIQMTKKKEFFFLLLNGNKQPLCLGEHYKSKVRCESAVESVKRFAPNAPIFMNGVEVKD